MSLAEKIVKLPESQHIFTNLNDIFTSSQLQTKNKIQNWNEPERTVMINAIDILFKFNKIITDFPSLLESVYFLAFNTYVNISICISSLDKLVTTTNDKQYQKNKERLIEECDKNNNKLKSIIEARMLVNEIEERIKNSPTYLNKRQLKELFKDWPLYAFNQALKDLEENNKIMYDKNDTIIWLFVDNHNIKEILEKSTVLR